MKIGNLECYGVIYKITNKVNGKVYIGQTSKSGGFKKRYDYGGDGIIRVYKYHKNHKKYNKTHNEHLYLIFNLQYKIKGVDSMIFNIHAGHGASNSKSCGSIGLINESDEARKVKNEVVRLLKEQGHIIYDCTVDYPTGSQDCLNKIVANCNKNSVDLDVSIHFNSAANDKVGNGVTTGVEVYLYNSTSKAKPYAERVCKKISALGFKNRGVKYSTKFAVLKTKNPNMLIECCFVDDKDDVKLYDYKSMAKAIVEGILNKEIKDMVNEPQIGTVFKNGDYTGKKARVIASVLNIRYDRGTQYDVIGKLNKGDIVKLNYCLNDWISIEGYKGNKGLGYINTNYIELI